MKSLALLLVGFLASCAQDLTSFAERHTTPAERRFAPAYLRMVASGRHDSAFALLRPDLQTDEARTAMRRAASALSTAKLDSLHFLGVNVRLLGGSRGVNLTYEVPTASDQWVVANVATEDVNGHVRVTGFSAQLIPTKLEAVHAFTLRGKSFKHYLWLILATLMPLICGTTAVIIARARGMPRRWFWALCALVGTPAFVLNWTTGQTGVHGLSFLFFGAAATRPGAATPWTIAWAIPIGALVAFQQLRAWRKRQTHSDVVVV